MCQILLDPITLGELLDAQKADPWCNDLLLQLQDPTRETRPPGLFLDPTGALCCLSVGHVDFPRRWVAPAAIRPRLCVLGHFSAAAGHPGITKMTATMTRHWYWPSLARDCAAAVRRCPNCAEKRLKGGPKKSVPLTIFPPDRSLEFIAMDVLVPLPQTPRGNRFVLCIGDRFSKLAVAVPLSEQTASIIAYAFMDRWIAYYGIPVTVLTDNGASFTSKFFRVMTTILGVKQVFTSAYRPATNGQIERWNVTLVDSLTHIATERNWDLHFGTACLAYNSFVHSSTGFAPIELSGTREPAPNVWCRPIGEPPRH